MTRSFRSRLILIFGGLFAAALAVTFLAVQQAQARAATAAVSADLRQDSAVFDRLVAVRSDHLLAAARLLASDFAFKQAYATGDTQTVVSAMGNLLSRVEGADLMLLLSLDGEVLASTEELPAAPGADDAWVELVYAAEDDEYGEASSILPLAGRIFQAMVVPLLAPDLEAWVAIGFRIDQAFAEDFSELTLSEITILRRSDGDWTREASTLGAEPYAALVSPATAPLLEREGISTLGLAGQQFITSAMKLVEDPATVVAVLQRSLDEELRPYRRVQRLLIAIFGLGLTLAIAGAVLAARSVTRPVLAIANAAQRIEQGDYEQAIQVRRRDEIGRMAHSFNHMARGLAEKERVRDLLGKVVSPAIAEELMRREIDLGGEEREVTILFSDVRSFTTLCEGRSPRDILELLNLYLTEVSTAISERGGVVDKYIGDAVMALFGAPLEQESAPADAVWAAFDMIGAVERLNPRIEEDGWPPLEIGVGVNTDVVVAGNMGSIERLNYTVIGDGVNLASRLEGLTKVYGLPILVTETTVRRASGLRFRELDLVRVKGKQQPVALYEPLTPSEDPEAPEDDLFARGLRLYRERSWDRAAACFAGFAEQRPRYRALARLYARRIEDLREHPPPEPWDRTHTFTEK